jgi:hypothetical protein
MDNNPLSEKPSVPLDHFDDEDDNEFYDATDKLDKLDLSKKEEQNEPEPKNTSDNEKKVAFKN